MRKFSVWQLTTFNSSFKVECVAINPKQVLDLPGRSASRSGPSFINPSNNAGTNLSRAEMATSPSRWHSANATSSHRVAAGP